MDDVQQLHQLILGCRLCEQAGFIERAAPVVSGRAGNRMMVIGQAPGITELQVRRPFNGRAGRELFRWMQSIGIDEVDFRTNVYMTAITKCFPGRVPGGSGDRRPSHHEVALCRPWLEAQLALIRPASILLIGSLALAQYFPGSPLSSLVGERLEREGVGLIPLPHPSGASRWLNQSEHRALLQRALQHVRDDWERLVLCERGAGCETGSMAG